MATVKKNKKRKKTSKKNTKPVIETAGILVIDLTEPINLII